MSLIEFFATLLFLVTTLTFILFARKLVGFIHQNIIADFIIPVMLLIIFSALIFSSTYWTVYFEPNKTFFNLQDIIKVSWWLAIYRITFIAIKHFLWIEVFEKLDVYVPNIIKDFVNLLLLFVIAAFVSHFVYHSNLIGFFTLTSVMAIMFGYSAQILTNDIFSGIGLHMIRQFKPGDWIKMYGVRDFDIIGKVEEINSRFVLLTTLKNDRFSIPNSMIGKNPIQNFSVNDKSFSAEIILPIRFPHSPTKIKHILLSAVSDIPEVKKSPKPYVFLSYIDAPLFEYKVCFFSTIVDLDKVRDKVLSIIWYKFEKSYIHFNDLISQEFNFPNQDEITCFLGGFHLFSTLTEDELIFLSKKAKVKFFGPPEQILQQNTKSNSLYIIYSGGVDIYIDIEADVPKKIASLEKGAYLGEMSLLTGDLTTASVFAHSETYIIQIGKKILAKLFNERPELIQQMSEIIVERQFSNKKFMEKHDNKKNTKASLISQLFDSIKNFFS